MKLIYCFDSFQRQFERHTILCFAESFLDNDVPMYLVSKDIRRCSFTFLCFVGSNALFRISAGVAELHNHNSLM